MATPFVRNARAVETYLRSRLRRLYPEATALRSFRLRPVSTTVAKQSSVVQYEVRLGLRRGVRSAVLMGTFDRRGGKKQAFRVMRHLWAHGFDRGLFQVPRPLAYDAARKFFLYESFPGRTLRSILETRPTALPHWVRLSAKWLAKLHAIPPSAIPMRTAAEDRRRMTFLLTGFRKALGKESAPMEQSLRFLLNEKRKILRPSRFVLTHQDPHVSNFIAGEDNKTVAAVDFGESRRYDPAADVGQYLVHLDTALHGRLTLKEIISMKRMVVNTYRRAAAKRLLGPDFAIRVNLHQAWACFQFWQFTLAYFPPRDWKRPNVRWVLNRYREFSGECVEAVRRSTQAIVL